MRPVPFTVALLSFALACTESAPPAAPMSQTVPPAAGPVVTVETPVLRPGGEPTPPTPQPLTETPKAPVVEAPKTVSGNITLTTALSNDHLLMPGKGTVHLAIDLDAKPSQGGGRLPMNVALVVDRSGSMRGEKIQQTREAARDLVGRLSDEDTIAIVSYGDDVRVDIPAGRATEDQKRQALDAISRIQPGGSTNLSGGLSRGQEEVEKGLGTGQVNRVILMSDGLANRGITDTKALAQQAQKASQRGVSVSTLGVGADYNEDLMTALADSAGGNYYFIKSATDIAGVLGEELKKMFATVGQAATVELAIDDGAEVKQVFGYTFTQQDGRTIIPLAEVFGGQKRSILVELEVPVVRAGRAPIGQVKLSYTDVAAGGRHTEATVDLAVQVTTDAALVEKTRNRGVEERIEEVRVAHAMTQAADLLRDGRAEEARQVLRVQATTTATRAAGMGGSGRLDVQVNELKKMDSAFGALAAEPAPAAAAETIKAVKAKSHSLSR